MRHYNHHLQVYSAIDANRSIISRFKMIDRLWEKISKNITKDQAAYQPGRSTTEQVFAVKMICDKAITSNDYTAYLLLLDMSKAFDTVDRKILFEHLEEILEEDELRIMHILNSKPKLKVKVKDQYSDIFNTYLGIMQGDGLSAILFIYYLAHALKEKNEENNIKNTILDETTLIQPKYADDITYVSISKEIIPKKSNMKYHKN